MNPYDVEGKKISIHNLVKNDNELKSVTFGYAGTVEVIIGAYQH